MKKIAMFSMGTRGDIQPYIILSKELINCGFGTTAATFIYGIPSIPIPHILDQKSFAKQLYDTKVSTKPINAKDLSEEILIKAIQEMKNTYTDKKKVACELSKKINDEGGVAKAVKLIQEAMN